MKRPPLPRFEHDLHFDRRRAVRGRKIGGFDADDDSLFLTSAGFTSTGGRTNREPSGEDCPNECTGEAGPRLGDLSPDYGPLGELPVREDLDLEHVIIRADCQGRRVHIGNAVSVIIVDIGDKDVPRRTILSGVILPRRRIGASGGGDRSRDTEG